MTAEWRKIECKGPRPLIGSFPSAVCFGSHILLMGGALNRTKSVYSFDTGMWFYNNSFDDLVSFTWKRLKNAYIREDSLTANLVGLRVFAFGGFEFFPKSKVTIFDIVKPKWRRLIEPKEVYTTKV